MRCSNGECGRQGKDTRCEVCGAAMIPVLVTDIGMTGAGAETCENCGTTLVPDSKLCPKCKPKPVTDDLKTNINQDDSGQHLSEQLKSVHLEENGTARGKVDKTADSDTEDSFSKASSSSENDSDQFDGKDGKEITEVPKATLGRDNILPRRKKKRKKNKKSRKKDRDAKRQQLEDDAEKQTVNTTEDGHNSDGRNKEKEKESMSVTTDSPEEAMVIASDKAVELVFGQGNTCSIKEEEGQMKMPTPHKTSLFELDTNQADRSIDVESEHTAERTITNKQLSAPAGDVSNREMNSDIKKEKITKSEIERKGTSDCKEENVKPDGKNEDYDYDVDSAFTKQTRSKTNANTDQTNTDQTQNEPKASTSSKAREGNAPDRMDTSDCKEKNMKPDGKNEDYDYDVDSAFTKQTRSKTKANTDQTNTDQTQNESKASTSSKDKGGNAPIVGNPNQNQSLEYSSMF